MLSENYDRALAYASDLHREQVRKGTTIPYISHLLAVSALVIENGGDEVQAIAALLHDAAEDQGGEKRLAHIREEFGKAVSDIVHACTDAWTEPKPEWWERKRDYLNHLPEATPSSWLVSLADKVHNSSAIVQDVSERGSGFWEVFNTGKAGTLWYYSRLSEIYGRLSGRNPGLGVLSRQLDRNVAAMLRL